MVEAADVWLLIKGAILATAISDDYFDVAVWITLESRLKNNDSAFLISTSIPNACLHLTPAEKYVDMLSVAECNQVLMRLKTKWFVFARKVKYVN